MARASLSVLAVLVLLGLIFAPAHSQDVSNTTSTDPVATDVDSNTTTTTCPLSADALQGVDFSGATTACSGKGGMQSDWVAVRLLLGPSGMAL